MRMGISEILKSHLKKVLKKIGICAWIHLRGLATDPAPANGVGTPIRLTFCAMFGLWIMPDPGGAGEAATIDPVVGT